MELEGYYFEENERNIFFITYLQICYNKMILIFPFIKSKSSKNKLFLDQNYSNQNDSKSESKIMIWFFKIMPISDGSITAERTAK